MIKGLDEWNRKEKGERNGRIKRRGNSKKITKGNRRGRVEGIGREREGGNRCENCY